MRERVPCGTVFEWLLIGVRAHLLFLPLKNSGEAREHADWNVMAL